MRTGEVALDWMARNPAPVMSEDLVAEDAIPKVPKLVFGLTIFDEGLNQLSWCLSHLRSVYTRADVFVISDGMNDKGYRELCRRHPGRLRPGRPVEDLGERREMVGPVLH